jgi:hypothetical protein
MRLPMLDQTPARSRLLWERTHPRAAKTAASDNITKIKVSLDMGQT